MKKNGFTMVELIAVIVIMTLILLIVFPSINSTIKNSEEKKKQETLNNIYMAAENYLLANYDNYNIDNIGDTTYIYITDLINNNYMSIDTLNPNNDSSFSSKDVVKITRQDNGTFSYELDYIKTLIEILLEQYDSSKTTGLLRDSVNENLYYYTGTNDQVANNFLWYGGHQWRVLEFNTSDNTLTLITQQPLTSIQPASTTWTNEQTYNDSYVNTWLNDYFWNSLDGSIQSNILDNAFNIGIYSDVDEITTTKKVGLLDYDQYVRAGRTNSFLDIKDNWWLSSPDAYFVSNVGSLDLDSVTTSNGVRAVIKISDIPITNGDGTLTNNFQLLNKVTNINNVQVGEYINVPYSGSDNACGSDKMCTFRVVSKGSNSIKIVLNGLLSTTSEWADNTSDNITINDLIYINLLNGFIGNIESKYITTGTYGVEVYEYGSSYTSLQTTTIKTNIGLPTIGEMFSGNDIDLSTSSTKTFIDVNTIESPIASNNYWTMNRSNSSYVFRVYSSGDLGYSTSNTSGVRPVIYLKSNLTFTGGDGTPQNPYTLD